MDSVTEVKGHLNRSAMLRNLGSIPPAMGAIKYSSQERRVFQLCFGKIKSEGGEVDVRGLRWEKPKMRGNI